jgi:hypothetical protein
LVGSDESPVKLTERLGISEGKNSWLPRFYWVSLDKTGLESRFYGVRSVLRVDYMGNQRVDSTGIGLESRFYGETTFLYFTGLSSDKTGLES